MALLLKSAVFILSLTSVTLIYLMLVEFNPFIRRCNPDVCNNYALSAFRTHTVRRTGADNCEYGVLPGVLSFNVMKPVGERWQTAMGSCRLKNLMAADAPTGSVRVMMFGDSVDARMAQAWCALQQQPLRFTPTGIKGNVAAFTAAVKAKAGGGRGDSNNNSSSNSSSSSDPGQHSEEGCCKNRDLFYYCKPGRASKNSISIGMYHLLGVHLDGPYHTGAKGNFLTRIPAALKTFNATFGGPPDLVVVHSNFWDQTRMWEQQQPGYGQLNKLLPDVVFSYSSNFSLLLSTAKEYLPETVLIATRTAAFPAFTANWLGRWQYIHQLNNAAMEVTRLHGHAVIDLGGMLFGLEPRTYLDDQHHPTQLVLLECANVALNLLMQQRKRLAAEALAPADSSDADSDADMPPDNAVAAAAAGSAANKARKSAGNAGAGAAGSRESGTMKGAKENVSKPGPDSSSRQQQNQGQQQAQRAQDSGG